MKVDGKYCLIPKSNYAVFIGASFCSLIYKLRIKGEGFPGCTVVENLPASAGDTGSSPGLGRSHIPRSD